MAKWTHNIQKWYRLVQFQSQEMRTKPFEETPYGNQQVLSQNVDNIGKEIKIFTVDPFITLASPNEETQKIEEY